MTQKYILCRVGVRENFTGIYELVTTILTLTNGFKTLQNCSLGHVLSMHPVLRSR